MNTENDFPTKVPEGAICVIKVNHDDRLFAMENGIWVDAVTKAPLSPEDKVSVPSQGYADRFGTE